jgi:integrase/recombinase XerC
MSKTATCYAEVAEHYLKWLQLSSKDKPDTLRVARRDLRLALRICDGADERHLDHDMVDEFVRVRMSQGIQASTINRGLKFIKASLNHALERRLVSLADVPSIKLLKQPSHQPQVMTEEQVTAVLLRASKHGKLFPPVFCTAHWGLRVGELCALRVGHLDLDRALLHVRAQDGWSPKNRRERTIPISDSLKAWLKDYLTTLPSLDLDAPLFQAEPGLAWTPKKLLHHLRVKIWEPLAIPRNRRGVHGLRRVVATKLLSKGAPIHVVRDVLGHSTIQVTEKYLGSSEAIARAAMATIDVGTQDL